LVVAISALLLLVVGGVFGGLALAAIRNGTAETPLSGGNFGNCPQVFDTSKLSLYEASEPVGTEYDAKWVITNEAKTYAINDLGIPENQIKQFRKEEVEDMIRAEVVRQFSSLANNYGSSVSEAQRAILSYQKHESSAFQLFNTNGTPSYTHDSSGDCTNMLSLTNDKFWVSSEDRRYYKNKRTAGSYDIKYAIYLGVKENMGAFSNSVSGSGLNRWKNTIAYVFWPSNPSRYWDSRSRQSWENYKNETPYSCVETVSTCRSGVPASEVSGTFDGITYTMPDNGRGSITHENHIITTGESQEARTANLFAGDRDHPARSNDMIAEHLAATGFSQNCPSSSSYCDPNNQEWTPAEPTLGVGSKVPPANHEPWIMNSRWFESNVPTGRWITPPAGTKVIITASKTKKSIVAVAGYEWGPSTDHVAGAQAEVLANLGIGQNDQVAVGFAIDQSLTPGTVYSGGRDCSGIVVLDPGHGNNCPTSVIRDGLCVPTIDHSDGDRGYIGEETEKGSNWDMAIRIKKMLEDLGVTVSLTKESKDACPSLFERVKFANDHHASAFVSLHSNASGGSGPLGLIFCEGIENCATDEKDVSCANTTSATSGLILSKKIIPKISENMNLRSPRYMAADYGVLDGLNMPGTIIEMFAHDIQSDLNKIEGKRDLLAKSIADGIIEYLNQ